MADDSLLETVKKFGKKAKKAVQSGTGKIKKGMKEFSRLTKGGTGSVPIPKSASSPRAKQQEQVDRESKRLNEGLKNVRVAKSTPTRKDNYA